MGKPSWGHAQLPPAEHIGRREATRGTETSKYPEEEKEKSISQVAASETERAQTRNLFLGLRTDHQYKSFLIEHNWKVGPQKVIVL